MFSSYVFMTEQEVPKTRKKLMIPFPSTAASRKEKKKKPELTHPVILHPFCFRAFNEGKSMQFS